MLTNRLKSILTAFSLSALTFYFIWTKILDGRRYYDYPTFELDPVTPIITWFWMIVLTIILTLLFNFSNHRFVKYLSYLVVGICGLIILNTIRLFVGINRQDGLFFPSLVFSFIILSGVAYGIYKHQLKTLELFQKVLLALSPFALIVTIKALWTLVALFEKPPVPDVALAHHLENPRIVWMIFDEFDPRLAFENSRSPKMPHLEKLKSESVFATQAYAAGSCTMQSIPGMLSGLNLDEPKILNDQNVEYLNVDTNQKVTWNDIPNVFEENRRKNMRSALLGNFHPYQKILGKNIDECSDSCIPSLSLIDKFIQQSHLLFYQILMDGIPLLRTKLIGEDAANSLTRQLFIDCYREMFEKSKKICCDSKIDLVFIHWPIPHHPGIFHAESKQFLVDYNSTYFDNLVLVDETVGAVRKDMEAAGIWNSTTIIITSDHWFRKHMLEASCCDTFGNALKENIAQDDFRVPLYIKLAHQNEPIVYSGKIRLYRLHDLVGDIQDCKVNTHPDLVSWMQKVEPEFTLQGLANH